MPATPTFVPLSIEYGQYAAATTDDYLALTTTDGGQLARIYARWDAVRAGGQGHPAGFAEWLATVLPHLVRHPAEDDSARPCRAGHTADYDTLLDAEIGGTCSSSPAPATSALPTASALPPARPAN